jgi:uncharacterized lipoprotein YddW (UPF0748 family)
MKQTIRRPLIAILASCCLGPGLPLPAAAQSPTPFFSLPQPNGSDAAQLASDFNELNVQLKAVNQLLLQAQAAHRDVPLGHAATDLVMAGMALNTAGMQLDQGNVLTAARDLRLAHERLRNAQLLMMPSRVAEARGLYMDAGSLPKTKAGIVALLDQLDAAHFNLLVPEVFRRGYALWPTQLTDQDPEFAGLDFDLFGFLVDEAHRRGMDVQPWFWVFRVRSPGFGNPVLDRLPGITASKAGVAEPRFISPASPEGRAFAAAIVNDMVRKYKVEGVVLDYVRYDETLPDDDISVTKFKLQYYSRHGHFPTDLAPGSPIFVEWQLWREEQVHQLVKQVAKDLPVPITAAVFRGAHATRLAKMQDWHHWVDNRWVDVVSHMLYTPDVRDLDTWLDWETEHGKRNDVLYPILGPLRFNSKDDLWPQLGLLRQRLIPGAAYFALAHLDRSTLPDLAAGPYRQAAYLPHRGLHRAARREIDGIADWLERIKGEPTMPAVIGKWLTRLREVWAIIPGDDRPWKADLALAVISEIDAAVNDAQAANDVDGAFAAEVRDRLRYPVRLLGLHQLAHRPQTAYVPPTVPAVGVIGEARALPETTVPFLESAPTIDGAPDPIWAQAATVNDFFWANGLARADADTTVRVGYDSEHLYLRVEAEEFAMGATKAQEQQRDQRGRFTDDDRFDLLLQGPDGADYTFSVNLANAQYDAKGRDATWNGGFTSAVIRQASGWVVEMAVPLGKVNLVPERGTWRANLVRYRQQERVPVLCWSAPLAQSPVPARFGTWHFGAMPAAR